MDVPDAWEVERAVLMVFTRHPMNLFDFGYRAYEVI